MKTTFTAIFIAALALSGTFAKTTTPTVSDGDFVLDPDRAYVYLLFERVGNGPLYEDDEPTTRIWFRFVNNCRVPITVQTFGTPKGSALGEVGLMHDVVENTPSGMRGVKAEPSESSYNAKQQSSPLIPISHVQMPSGYVGDLSSKALIQPSDSLLFSIPITHLSRDWHLEIPYDFELPKGKCCRPPIVGGEPQMFLLYFDSDLPEEVQQKLPRKK